MYNMYTCVQVLAEDACTEITEFDNKYKAVYFARSIVCVLL